MNQPLDMSRFIEAKSDQLNADDLIGAPRTITVTRVAGADGDQPVAIFFQGDNNKPFKPCKTMRRVLLAVWGRYANEYVGRSMTIYRDEAVTFGGLNVGGIRISHMSHIDKETVVVVMKSKGKKAGIKIMPLQTPAQSSPDQNRAKAERWLAEYEADLKAATTTEQLHDIHRKADKAVSKLERQLPDLFERAQVLRPPSSLPVEPATGRGDEDHGERFNGAEDDGFSS